MKTFENVEVAWVLDEIADLLEIKGEEVFKIRAYRRAARVIENMTTDIMQLFDEDKLNAIPGVGKNIAAKLKELLSGGQIEYLEKLREEVPPVIVEIMSIPGVGPKTANTLYAKLGIKSVEELEEAAKKRQIRVLPGMGSKTEMNLIRGIKMLKSGGHQINLGIAWSVGHSIKSFLQALKGVVAVEVAGSTRRMKEFIGDIDLVVATEDPEAIIETFLRYPYLKEVLAKGSTKVSVLLKFGVQVDLRLVKPEEFWPALHHFTGSKEHNVRLRERSQKLGIKINEYGLFYKESGQQLPLTSETDIYAHLELPYIPPELREDQGEFDAAEKGELPQLIDYGDIKGDLHLHSRWSDGGNTIEELVEQAQAMGYEYIAITDHSKSLGIAGGLSVERLMEQEEEIRRISGKTNDKANEKTNDKSAGRKGKVKILSGIEADILANGEMDYPDHILAAKDIVIGSVHSGFRQGREKMTERILAAVKHEDVDIIAHPTGRLIGRRDPYDVDIEKVMETAAKYNKVLELNASPDRLDLKDTYLRQAREMGIKIAINTDAHELNRMKEMRFGVGTARRGWLEKKDVINTWSYAELVSFLKRE